MFPVLLRHADFVAINKPADVSVHQDQDSDGLTQQLAAQLCVSRVWLVHRLDKPTSGVLLLALNETAASVLAQQFAERTMQKTYIALSDRKPLKKQGWIKGGMEKSRRGTWKLTRSNEHTAVTEFKSSSAMPGIRLFELHPHTGRTHQLRVALKSIGSPILGDTLYGGTPADRLFLHALNLSFDYHGEHFDITAPADAAWQPYLSDGL
ncbi:TIGR01621 family pseudouridine synthase [Neisseria zoodegmatis]|uniref:Psedouridine synthase n=1 Tax=Neisseria zoodegmatis TaxID=326523 RepID=A0AB38DPJ0_9NEIS|nr:TIGR01621 family pseudouridine synthase [Neisseria zoodegmatis]OSI10448.1 RNA pseudouridine synthase [Neisseria zoodegmatis]SNU79147.1 putative psedouridine synthase [Neisseria zoodegmatis]